MTVRVKICGITTAADAAVAAEAGADFIGLNFWSRSKRRVDPAHAASLAAAARAARADIGVVGLFVDPTREEVAAAVAAVRLDAIQLHGDEDAATVGALAALAGAPVWKAVAVATSEDIAALDRWPVDTVLLDAPSAGRGGSGQRFDWGLARAAVARHRQLRIVLAGGLGPDNVAAAIAEVTPWAVDVASGVEIAPGQKDPERVRAFVRAARSQHDTAGDAA